MRPEDGLFACFSYEQADIDDFKDLNKEWLPTERHDLYEAYKGHYYKYQKFPDAMTVQQQWGILLAAPVEPYKHYLTQLRDSAIHRVLQDSLMQQVAIPMRAGDAESALSGLQQVAQAAAAKFKEVDDNYADLTEISHGARMRMRDYIIRSRSKGCAGLRHLYEPINKAIGGLRPGDLWMQLARPNLGKTWCAVFLANHLVRIGYNVLFVSMETPPAARKNTERYHKVIGGQCMRCFQTNSDPNGECDAYGVATQRLTVRFDAVAAHVSPLRFLRGELQPLELERVQQYYAALERGIPNIGELRVVSRPVITNVSDIATIMQDNSYDIVIVDSAYLCNGQTTRPKNSEHYGTLLNEFKAIATGFSVPVYLTWHFNRDVGENDLRATDRSAAFTDEAGRIVDVILGFFRTPQMRIAGEALYTSIKVRDGVGDFKFFTNMILQHDLDYRLRRDLAEEDE